jgi:hypothetical protein
VKRLLLSLVIYLPLSTVVLAETKVNLNIRDKHQELHVYGDSRNPPVILSSGDLGWEGLVEHVAELLSSRGYYVVGFSTRAYLADFTSKTATLKPEQVPRDYKILIDYVRQGRNVKPILAGISEGAGLSVLSAADPTVKSMVRGVLGLGLPDQNELGWKWRDFGTWITKRNPNEPSFMVEDVIQSVSPLPLAEIHSTHDEFLSLEDAKHLIERAKEPKKMWVIEATNHRFSDNRDELDRRILEALAWIEHQN